jgi:adenine deaminase
MKKNRLFSLTPTQMKELMAVALGESQADLVVANGDLVNVYSGELLKGYSVAIKGERIAYVGKNAEHTIGPATQVIDATGKVMVPGFIDTHTHIFSFCVVDEFLRYAMKGGTTTIVTELLEPAFFLGYRGVTHFLKAIADQPIKILATVPPMVTISPTVQKDAFGPQIIRRLLQREEVVGLGEGYWSPTVIEGGERYLELFSETLASGKKVEGHSAGARDKKLAAYLACGVSSCHESITAEEVRERLRMGICTMIREGDIRRDLEAVAEIKDEKIDFRHLALVTDGVFPQTLLRHGYMEFVVQRAIELGFDPIIAIQMVTINPAEHFHLDTFLGGIAPGKYADIVIIPALGTIQAELVISNGKVIARKGELLSSPQKYYYPQWMRRSVQLSNKFTPADFAIHAEKRDEPIKVRVINMVTNLVSQEAQVALTPVNGELKADVEEDILKIAVIDRTNQPGKKFVGFVKGFQLKRGAVASTLAWDLSGIIVVGANEEDIASAVNRTIELQGGIVVCAEGKILAELPLTIGGFLSELPLETIMEKLAEIQQKANELGATFPDVHLSLTVLTSPAIPYFCICESGLIDIRDGKIVGLFKP